MAEALALQNTSPMGLLQLAIEREGSIDVIERLAKLQMEMMDREARVAYVCAFEEFKQNAPELVKDAEILVNGASRGKYAKLDQVAAKLIPALLRVGITHRWKTDTLPDGRISVTCYLRHRLGYEEAGSTMAGPADATGSKNAVQAITSTVAYFQRSTLVTSCGIAVKDQDKNGETINGLDVKDYAPLMEAIEGARTVSDVTAAYIKALKAAKTEGEKRAFEAAAIKRKGDLGK